MGSEPETALAATEDVQVTDSSPAASSDIIQGEEQTNPELRDSSNPAQSSQQTVRFSSKNQEIEPENLVTATTTLTEERRPFAEAGVEAQLQALSLSQTLNNSRPQQTRFSNFAFEPVSLPASRVPSNEIPPRSREASETYQPSPTSSPSLRASMQSPPLTPAGSQSQENKVLGATVGRTATKGLPDPAIVTPQTSPPRNASTSSIGKSVGDASDATSSTSKLTVSTGGEASTRPTSASEASSGMSSQHQKKGTGFSIGPTSDSKPPSREGSPSGSRSGAASPFRRPFTPAGDVSDPYARSKRKPPTRNKDDIESRFIFSGRDSRRAGSQSGPSASSNRLSYAGEPKVSDEKRHSHVSLHAPKKEHRAHLHEDDGSSQPGSKHGSMTDLKRFFHIGGHKHKRGQSPVPSVKSAKSGTRTPPHQVAPATVPFADDHGMSSKLGKFGKVLGTGAGGSVRLMKRSGDGTTFAVKEFRARHPHESEKEYSKKVTAEFCIGSTLHHGNIIETLDIVHERDRWYEVMEYAPYDLFAIVMTGKMSKEEVTCSFLQIVAGVTYLHSMGLAHRDLKLDNVVVNEHGIMKIIDFGSASVFRYPFETSIVYAHGIVGSDPYLAPEVYDLQRYDPQPTDIWSLAIIYCCMSLRRFPWKLPRTSDNSYKLFVSSPNGEDRRRSSARPASTADLPSQRQPPGSQASSRSPGNSRPASRQGSPEDSSSTSSHHHHHHHHHSHRPSKTGHAESEPTTRANEPTERKPSESSASVSQGQQQQQQQNVIKGPWRLLRLLPRESRSIIGHMLEVDPRRRAKLEDVLADPWMAETPVCQQLDGGRVIKAPGHTHTLEPGTGVSAASTQKTG